MWKIQTTIFAFLFLQDNFRIWEGILKLKATTQEYRHTETAQPQSMGHMVLQKHTATQNI
jgi:hypothetical protein